MAENDPRTYWNDPAAKQIALKLIADTCDAVVKMRDAGADAEAVLDTLCGNIAYLIEANFKAKDDADMIETVAWAIKGKLRDARQKMPGIRSTMSRPGHS